MTTSCAAFHKYAEDLFLKIICLLVFITAGYSVSSAAEARLQSRGTENRAAAAARQLRDYNNRIANGKSDAFSRPSQSSRPPFNNIAASSSTIFFFDDMESGTSGWTVGTHTDSAVWHQSTLAANSPTHSWWAGIEAQGNYNTGTRVSERLISPPIPLTGSVGSVSVLFTENYVTERGWDFCMVDVSTDGGSSWVHLRGAYGSSPSGDSYGWKVSSLDLTPYAGQTVNLSFFFDTGDSIFNAFPGWFVDNVAVFDQSGIVGGMVYLDMNQDGVFQGVEVGLAGRPIQIAGPVTLTATTNDDGTYALRLPLGSYDISEIVPSPWILTSSPASWNANLTVPDQTINNLSFGNYRSGSLLSGTVFDDINMDGVKDISDPALPGGYLELRDSLDDLVSDAYTDTSGAYSFFVWNSGTYYVAHYPEDGWVSTVPGGSTPTYAVVVPSTDTLINGLLFGEFFNASPGDSGIISGWVFDDLDHNGTQDDREPFLSQRVISLYLSGDFFNNTTTDSAGKFSFTHLAPGTYTVELDPLYRWQQSTPDSFYIFALASGQTRDSVIFGSYELPAGTVRGTVFNDLNRNGQKDTLEQGLSGWIVSALGPGSFSVDAVTDSAGRYSLNNVVIGPHTVALHQRDQWAQSSPPGSPWSISLSALEIRDSIDFGVYALLPGTITGTVFNDADKNSARDPGEGGLANMQIRLEGAATGTTSTNDSGYFQFTGLWSGPYTVRLIPSSNRRQTLPAMLLPHQVNLGDEEHHAGTDFGVAFDSTFNIVFRTFLPESLALPHDSKGKTGKAEKKKPYASEATFDLVTPVGGLTGLHVEFGQNLLPGSLTINFFTSQVPDGALRKWNFAMPGDDTLGSGDHVVIFARGNKGKTLLISKYWWIRGAENPAIGTQAVRSTSGNGRLLLLMPNTMNMLDEAYARLGNLSPLTIGLGGAHSVFQVKSADVWKSLLDKHGMHIGPPRCLGVYATTLKPISRFIKTLPPTKGNNVMFAEMLALKVNLLASELWLTPPGLGYLRFDEGSANRFNGLNIYQIAGQLDTAMSSFDDISKTCLYDNAFFDEAYRTIRMIDSAFSGPFDTLSYASVMNLTPVRNLSDVGFLHLDSSAASAAAHLRLNAKAAPLPEVFRLEQNYPNPFNPTTTIAFTLPQPSLVTLTVYNILGQEVASLLNREEMDDGDQEVAFDAGSLSSGVYFYHLKTEVMTDEDQKIVGQTFSAVRKMLLVK
ncbi:MAG TPA: SdrD B-like domain-containing protein [Bacteroidota bacterium]|nr:SdrD B-like domain-containing protein [Bacteroidota bacterium]